MGFVAMDKIYKGHFSDFYSDPKFRACIMHICQYEGAGIKNHYKYKGKEYYYPFGLDINKDSLKGHFELRTKTPEEHWRVMHLVLNEYYVRYYKTSKANLIEDLDIARCVFDVHINIGNSEATRNGINNLFGKTIVELVYGEMTVDSAKRINELAKDPDVKRQITEAIATFRIIRHSERFGDWKDLIAANKGLSESQLQPVIKKISKDKAGTMGNSLMVRSLTMIDGDYNCLGTMSKLNLDKLYYEWGIIMQKTSAMIEDEQRKAREAAAKDNKKTVVKATKNKKR